VETTHAAWTHKAEAEILALRDVEGVSIQADGDDVREVHILTTSSRPAKQIVRDVQTLLLTRFNRPIDHRVVSVAFAEPGPQPLAAPAVTVQTAAPAQAADRIRFVSANLYVSGLRAQAQVELRWRGVLKMGSASGWSTRDSAHRLIVTATLMAVQEYLDDDVAISIEGIESVRLARGEVAVVGLTLLAHREQKSLVGCSTVEQDTQQAVVLATLAALNRVVGGLPARELME
jgi:hypothetical protein